MNHDPAGLWYDSSTWGNGYAYGLNNPVSGIDPDGRFFWVVAGAVIGGAIAAYNGDSVLIGAVAGAAAAVGGIGAAAAVKALGASAAAAVAGGVGGYIAGTAAAGQVPSVAGGIADVVTGGLASKAGGAGGKIVRWAADAVGERLPRFRGLFAWRRVGRPTAGDKLPCTPAAKGVGDALRRLDDILWGRYCASGCEDVAAKIQGAIGGEIHRLKPSLPGASNLGLRSGRATGWAHHDVVVRQGRVYGAMTGPEGLPVDEFKALWDYADVIDFGF